MMVGIHEVCVEQDTATGTEQLFHLKLSHEISHQGPGRGGGLPPFFTDLLPVPAGLTQEVKTSRAAYPPLTRIFE